MHDSVLAFGERMVQQYQLNHASYSVLEIGAQNINGSLRQYFDGVAEYIGIDMQAGEGVDLVCNAHNLCNELSTHYGESKRFDIVINCEMAEHDSAFWLTQAEISVVLKPNGYLLMTARGVNINTNEAMFEHGYPNDYFRFMPQAVPLLHTMADCELIEYENDEQHPGFLSLGRKL